MKFSSYVTIGLFALALFAVTPVASAQDVATTKATTNPKPVYTPPRRGAPATRVGGGTRSDGTHSTRVTVLAPNHAGVTITAQPTLYWFTSTSLAQPVVITIVDEDAVEPLFERTLTPPISAGVHAINLDDENVTLTPGKDYQWGIAVVTDPHNRFKDIYTGNVVRHEQASAKLSAALHSATDANRARVLAAQGIWYDALDVLSRSGGAQYTARNALLLQAGLHGVAQ